MAKGQQVKRNPSRTIPDRVQKLLWGRAAARCEFAGCNRPLWRSSVTQESLVVGEGAHIYPFSDRGPRGLREVIDVERNELGNLMLLCQECHEKIDQKSDGGRYTVDVLRDMKRQHEERVERVTAIGVDKRSHVLLYGANIGAHSSPPCYADAAWAMFPECYPASEDPIDLTVVDSHLRDRDTTYWEREAENLRSKFQDRVQERIARGQIRHLSVFALAPQPLLIMLGSLLIDIIPADIYQRHREPPSWAWPPLGSAPQFRIVRPAKSDGTPALVLALSATVSPERIESVLGPDVSVWMVTTATPHNDVLKTRTQLADLRQLFRAVLNEIKASHGQTTPVHIFPAGPVAAAVEFGRVRMPKADSPWQVYDQVNERGGFVLALSIPSGGSES